MCSYSYTCYITFFETHDLLFILFLFSHCWYSVGCWKTYIFIYCSSFSVDAQLTALSDSVILLGHLRAFIFSLGKNFVTDLHLMQPTGHAATNVVCRQIWRDDRSHNIIFHLHIISMFCVMHNNNICMYPPRKHNATAINYTHIIHTRVT